jgi:hypothetical protein
MKRSTLKPSIKPLTRTPFKRRTPMPSTGMLSVQVHQRAAPARKAVMKSRQRSRTPADVLLHDRLAALGCIACMKDGVFSPLVSIHHIDGRTKPGCHQLVLPLCAGHHQDGTGEDKTLIAVHPWKARFEARYGTQLELLAECNYLLTGPSSAVVQASHGAVQPRPVDPRQITIFELEEL